MKRDMERHTDGYTQKQIPAGTSESQKGKQQTEIYFCFNPPFTESCDLYCSENFAFKITPTAQN